MLGLVISVALGYLVYRRAVKLNLARFFTVTGALLILVAAGVTAYGVGDLQEAGLLPGGTALAFDVSSAVPAGSWYGALLQGVLNLEPEMTWAAVIAYLGYAGAMLLLYLRPAPRSVTSSVAAA